MTAADLTALRALIACARQAGWQHILYQFDGAAEHVWDRNGVRVSWWNGQIEVTDPQYATPRLKLTPSSAAEVTAALGVVLPDGVR